MTVKLYSNASNPRAAKKSLTLIATATGTLKSGTSIQTPTIERVQLSGAPDNCNYMEIPEFGRSYFITNISAAQASGLWDISGACDVLSTAWPQISKEGAVIRRQTNKFNLYLPDDKFSVQARRSPQVITFPKALTASQSGACCVLTLVGAAYA